MFPKGTKRKLSDSGDDPAPEPSAPPSPPPRPLAPPSRPLASTYSIQRQSLLDMSLIKLQLCHMLVEPNLCRSVLIANTVRQIQEEMTQDGSWQLMTQALAAAQCPADRLVASELLCRQTDPQGPKPYALVGEAYHTEEVVMEGGEGGTYLAGPFGVTPCWQEEEEEDGDCEEEEEEDSDECVSEGEEQVFGTFEIKHPAPTPDPALDELFSDVDASYYDLDTVLTGMQAAPKMGPYDLLESLSSHGSAPLSSTTSCRADLNELDHIMEIIVGS
ncbi:hypothetical protein CRUP_019488 [Coryphaenoides rupestris]|nr:hypothetical protein CRUP_019488 [Coryphaenoides rupestris]